MAFVLSFPTSWIRNKGQIYHDFSRLQYIKLKQKKSPFKILAEKRTKFAKDGWQERKQDKKLIQIKILNNTLKNSPNVVELFQLMQKNQNIMNEINVSTSATAAARISKSKLFDDVKYKTVYIAVLTLLNKLILQHVNKMNSQSVSNCLSSLVKIFNNLKIEKKQEYNHVFEKLCERAMLISNEMKIQSASNSLWAIAKFQWEDTKLIQKLIKQAITSSNKEFIPQNICNIIWSMATLKYCNINAIQHFVELSKTCVQEMNGQDVGNLIWALKQLRYYDQEFVLQIEDIIIYNKNIVFDSQNISNIMLAFTDFGLENKQKIFEILVQQFISIKVIKLQDWTNFLYALALLDCPLNLSQKVVDKFLAYQNQNKEFQDFNDIQLTQIQVARVFYNIRGQKLYFPSELEQKCKKKLQGCIKKQTLLQNSFLDKVFPIIKSHFDFSKKQILIYDDQIDTDITLQKGGQKVAIMVNAIQSYFVNYPEKLLGRSQHKAILLQNLGWQVIEINAFQWNNNPQYQQQVIDDIEEKFI